MILLNMLEYCYLGVFYVKGHIASTNDFFELDTPYIDLRPNNCPWHTKRYETGQNIFQIQPRKIIVCIVKHCN